MTTPFPLKKPFLMLAAFLFFQAQFAISGENLSLVVEKVVTQNPHLKGARARIDSAKSGFGEIRSQRYPRLAVRSSYTHGNNPVYVFGSLLEQQAFGPQNFAIDSLNNPSALTNIKNSLDLGLPLFMGFEVVSSEKIQKMGVEQAQEQFGMADQQVRFQAVDGYLFVLLKQEVVNALSERIQFATKEIEDARKLNAKGLVLGSDFYAAQAILSSLNAQQIQVQKELQTAIKRMAIMMGESANSLSYAGSLSSVNYSIKSEEDLIAQGLATRRDMKEADLNVLMADASLEQAGRSFLPKIEAFASLETNTENFESNPTNQTVGVRSNFPIGDPTYFSRKSKAKAAARATRSEKERVEEAIRMEVMEAVNQYEGTKECLPSIQEAVRQAAKSLDLFRPLYREGRQSILDVLRAEDGLWKAKAALLENLYHLHIGYARIHLATGSLDSSSIKEIQNNLETLP